MKSVFIFILIVSFFNTNLAFAAINTSQTSIPAKQQTITSTQDTNKLKSQAILLYSTNNIEKAYQILNQIDEINKDAEVYLLLANILQDYGKSIDSVFLLQKSILKDPKFYKPYYNLANIYFQDNKFNLAIKNYKYSLKYNPKFPYAYYNLANCYFNLKEYNKAIKYYIKAIKITSEPDFYYNLALSYKNINNLKQAEKYLNIYNELLKQKLAPSE